MGVEYYLKVPELKALFWLGSNLPDDYLEYLDEIDKFLSAVEEYHYEPVEDCKLKDFTVGMLTKVMNMATRSYCIMNEEDRVKLLPYALSLYQIDFELVNDSEMDLDVMKRGGWKVYYPWK